MATIQGTGGGLTLPTGFVGKIQSWAGRLEYGTADITGFSDGGYRTKAHTSLMMSGSAVAVADDAATNTPISTTLLNTTTAGLSACTGTIVLLAQTGCQYSFTGNITSVGMERPADGKMGLTFDFKSSGAITETWDQTPP